MRAAGRAAEGEAGGTSLTASPPPPPSSFRFEGCEGGRPGGGVTRGLRSVCRSGLASPRGDPSRFHAVVSVACGGVALCGKAVLRVAAGPRNPPGLGVVPSVGRCGAGGEVGAEGVEGRRCEGKAARSSSAGCWPRF